MNVTSINQAGGITAQTVNVGHPPRTLAEPAAQRLKECLLTKAPKAGPWEVIATMGDAEAFALAGEIYQFMHQNGFAMKDREAVQGVFQRPVHDIRIQLENNTVIVGPQSRPQPHR